MESRIRLFGAAEERLREQLVDMLDGSLATLSYAEGEGILTLSADPDTVEDMTEVVLQRLGAYVYSLADESLEQRVVELLTRHGKTVATAESCTGGMVSARLTAVSGSSRVFGTGVVSYSCDCKQKLLQVSPVTLKQEGAVSKDTAGQMARGVRQTAAADIGVSVTGEAGPNPAEQPVGMVFIALADGKRTWVRELHLEGDRESIRRQAANHVLFLLFRYLEAYPTVMAGGESNRTAQRTIPRTQGEPNPRLRARLLPWRGDSPTRIAVKCGVWLLVLALLAGGGYGGYRYLLAPDFNRQLQSSLGDMYRDDREDLTILPDSGHYPPGMNAQFRGLYDRNTDVGGWIFIENTAVDYPVMQYGDGQYVNHNFNKQYSVYGQPYLGEGTELSSPVLTVYGRNTGDGQMFSDLLNYRRVAFLQEHSLIEMDTLYDTARWQIFAVLVVDEEKPEECPYARAAFADEADFNAYVEMLREHSLFRSTCSVSHGDRLLLLSVNAGAEYGLSSARLVIAARQVTTVEAATYAVNHEVKMPGALVRRTSRTNRPTTHSGRPADSTTLPATPSVTTGVTETTQVTTVPSSATEWETTTVIAPDGTTTAGEESTTTAEEDGGSSTVDADATTATEETTAATKQTEKTEKQNDDYIGN